jgi:hypothetical protein
MVDLDRPQMTMIYSVHFACWVTKATDTLPVYIYLILISFPWQQWFCERASVLCYTYIACLVYLSADNLTVYLILVD